MEKTLTLYQKLHKIQTNITGLKADAKANGYEYLSGKKLLSVVKPLMNELGLFLKTEIVGIENQVIDYKVKNGTVDKREVLTTLDFIFTWINVDTDERDSVHFSANGMNGFDKGAGSAMTYGERYFLMKQFHLDTSEDDVDNPDRDILVRERERRDTEEKVKRDEQERISKEKERDAVKRGVEACLKLNDKLNQDELYLMSSKELVTLFHKLKSEVK